MALIRETKRLSIVLEDQRGRGRSQDRKEQRLSDGGDCLEPQAGKRNAPRSKPGRTSRTPPCSWALSLFLEATQERLSGASLTAPRQGGTSGPIGAIRVLEEPGPGRSRDWASRRANWSGGTRWFLAPAGLGLTIKEPNCSPLESGVICSLRLSSSDRSWGLVRETGEDGGGGSARLRASPLRFTSSEMVSQGYHRTRSWHRCWDPPPQHTHTHTSPEWQL